jgi:hypothetical protein
MVLRSITTQVGGSGYSGVGDKTVSLSSASVLSKTTFRLDSGLKLGLQRVTSKVSLA